MIILIVIIIIIIIIMITTSGHESEGGLNIGQHEGSSM